VASAHGRNAVCVCDGRRAQRAGPTALGSMGEYKVPATAIEKIFGGVTQSQVLAAVPTWRRSVIVCSRMPCPHPDSEPPPHRCRCDAWRADMSPTSTNRSWTSPWKYMTSGRCVGSARTPPPSHRPSPPFSHYGRLPASCVVERHSGRDVVRCRKCDVSHPPGASTHHR
jgi:hypothetical protein